MESSVEKRTKSSLLRICLVLEDSETTWRWTEIAWQLIDRFDKLRLFGSIIQFPPRRQEESPAIKFRVVFGEIVDRRTNLDM